MSQDDSGLEGRTYKHLSSGWGSWQDCSGISFWLPSLKNFLPGKGLPLPAGHELRRRGIAAAAVP